MNLRVSDHKHAEMRADENMLNHHRHAEFELTSVCVRTSTEMQAYVKFKEAASTVMNSGVVINVQDPR